MRTLLALAVLATWVLTAQAQVDSGPKAGDKIASLKVFAVTGDPKEKDVDYSELRKDKPTVYVFVQAENFSRPMFRFIKELDEKVGEQALVVAVWLTDDAQKMKDYLPKVSQYFKSAALTVFPGEKAGPKDWGINADAHLTAVIANKGKAVKSFGFQSINDTDVPPVAEEVKKAVKN